MLEVLKETLKRKSLEGAKKIELDGETFYLKKSSVPLVGDWSRIYPPVNDDGSWNLLNLFFGGKPNLFKLGLIVFILILFVLGFNELFGGCKDIAAQPCAYCSKFINQLSEARVEKYWTEYANYNNISMDIVRDAFREVNQNVKTN
jgi:hypothetical protein